MRVKRTFLLFDLFNRILKKLFLFRINHIPNETMKRVPMPIATQPLVSSSSIHHGNNSPMPDLLWISKQQQQHPSTHSHPLKNTIRVASNGIRHKFDGKQWRPLCESPDGYECRNLAFRSSLCQKHFYKIHLFKRPYGKPGSIPPLSIKRPLSHPYEHQHHSHPHHQYPSNENHNMEDADEDTYDDDDSIQVLENNDVRQQKKKTFKYIFFVF
jgi:hypothetical protein